MCLLRSAVETCNMAPAKLQRERHDCYPSTADQWTDSFISFTSLILKATLHAMLAGWGGGGCGEGRFQA